MRSILLRAWERMSLVSPSLAPLGNTGIYLAMEVLMGNSSQKLTKGVLGFYERFHHEFTLPQSEIDDRSLPDPRFLGDGLWNAEGQTVAPLLNCHTHAGNLLVSTMEMPSWGGAC